MNYQEFKIEQRKDVDSFPIVFAFSQKQLDEGLAKLGVTLNEVFRLPSGGFIRKTDSKAFHELLDRLDRKLSEALLDDDFLLEALEYELGNHEYCITYDPVPTLNALDLSLDDERVARLFSVACKKYLSYAG
ncbi:MAG: hypothetical protein ABIK92_21880 [Pseudomonadota bacterium]